MGSGLDGRWFLSPNFMPINIDAAGYAEGVRQIASPNFDARPEGTPVCLLVIHNISLPPGEFGGGGIIDLFTNMLDPAAHSYYAQIAGMKVSAHFLIRRDGELIQFVSTDQRAWHAGESSWSGRSRCNDFSVGIELEGTDACPFEDAQYSVLADLVQALHTRYAIADIVGHADIAPGRKTDPGPEFDWQRLPRLI
jgi:AmpD protein